VPVFCHNFDLTKRLDGGVIQGQFHSSPVGDVFSTAKAAVSPLKKFISDVTLRIKNSPPATVHRIIIPSLLSPTIFASSYAKPSEVLQFLHSLRGLLRTFPDQLTAMVTLPISLYPRSTGLTRWAELLSDGAKSQGLLRAHSLPGFHERGGGLEGSWVREDLSFKLSSSSGLVITPFSLPPVGEDGEISEKPKDEKSKKDSLDF
jgi:elongator complex protein 4